MRHRKFLSLGLWLVESQRYKRTHLEAAAKTFEYFSVPQRIFHVISRRKPGIMGCSTSKLSISKATKADSPTDQDESADDLVEQILCKESDLQENQMKQFDLEDSKVLLVKQNGKISALGAKCTHYGAPLVNGALGDGRIRCQWHGACFSLETGDIEDFPGLDSLPCFKVTIEDSNVKVQASRAMLKSQKRQRPMAKRLPSNTETIVVIGGGPSGATCVETLRQEGFQGQVKLICKEDYLPYDRIRVSKAMDFDINTAQFRNDEFYASGDIDVVKGVAATNVCTAANLVHLTNGEQIHYDRLFIATGCTPRKVAIPGADLKNIQVLRNHTDAEATHALLSEQKEVVVLGGSFIAMEAANYCVNKVKKVTVVLRDSVPFKPPLGERIGGAFMKLFQSKGVEFVTGNSIAKCTGDAEGNVQAVELTDGTILPAHLVIMGTGSIYNTDFLHDSGIDRRADGSIEVNEYLQTNVANVYAGGDIAYAPVWSHDNIKAAIGHFPLAHYHGRVAALNMIEKRTPLKAVPFFWTMLFGKGVRYAGHGEYDDVVYVGNVEELKFVAFYLQGDEVVAISTCGMDPVASQFAELLAQGGKLFRADVTGEDPLKWTKK